MNRKISKIGISLIQSFEACRLAAYKPVATEPHYTIGWGHYGPDVQAGMTITQEQADSMFIADLAKYEACVNNPSYVPVTDKLTQNQFDALVSFCYNCGSGNLQRLCNARTVTEIAKHLIAYNKSNGTFLTGLTVRRQAELELFNKPETAKEEEDMQLSNYQWGVLETSIRKLLDNKKVTDRLWLDKIKERTLTTSELAWLTFVVSMR
ncbi:lysozyme [Paenibacillus sp. PR3]|uniref:Lysozyme n=1 Tax=Paenibacillus terricola TaxID=2763503 RepID=A0ABR8MNR5_9BACL|nr:lysozyme [Paenibacillus terricola]MBD3917645.1 lysozyme [Paenibacillus terricola]